VARVGRQAEPAEERPWGRPARTRRVGLTGAVARVALPAGWTPAWPVVPTGWAVGQAAGPEAARVEA